VLPLFLPRDREASFEPQLVKKNQTRWTGFDDKNQEKMDHADSGLESRLESLYHSVR
jgi:hypothetical protein